jgi:hypothetical protein
MKGSLTECYQIAAREEFFGGKDKRFYARFTSIWLRVFYPLKTKKVILDYKQKDNFDLVTNRLGIQEIMILNEKRT